MIMSTKRHTNEIDYYIGKNLRALRAQRGFSQGDLANVLNVTFQQIQKYELGTNRLSAASLYKLALHFKVSIDSFFVGRGDTPDKGVSAPEKLSADLRKITDMWQKIDDESFKKLVINLVSEKSRNKH